MAASKAALELLLQLKGDAEAARGLKSAQQDLKGLAAHAKTATTLLKGMFTAVGGYAVLRTATNLVRQATADIVPAAQEARAAQQQLNAVLASTGGIAGVTRDEVNALASALMDVTNVDDDLIVSAQAMLLTFTNIGREIFPEATEMALDLAEAFDTDLKSATVQLGKALNDPITGVTALTRVGIVFTQQQKDQIRTLVESGRTLDAQRLIMAELERQVGGSARAAADPLTQLSNAFGNLKEALGGELLPVLYRLALTAIPYLKQAAEGLPGVIQNLKTRIVDTAKTWIARFGDMELGTVRSVGRIAGFMWGLAKTAVSWGVNVVGSLGVGIASAVGLVTKALNFLGSVIGSLLKPGSPPKLLPELDTWGQGAAEAWLAGWTQADFGALRDFAGEVQGALRALAGVGEMDEGDVTAALLGSREAFAALLQQIRETGSASAEAFRRIREAAGPAGEQAEELARRYARVAEASGRLAEVQGRLRQIAGEQQDRLDTGRLAELEAILADPRASAGQRERALAEQERIRLLMEERDLQADLDAAQGELDAYRSRLEVETATRDLLREEVALVKGIAEKLKEATGGGLADELAEAAERAGAVVDAAEELQGYDLSELLAPLQEVIDELTKGFEEGELAAQNLSDTLPTLNDHLTTLNDHLATLNGTVGTTQEQFSGLAFFAGGFLRLVVGPLLMELNELSTNVGPRLNQMLGLLLLGFRGAVGQLLGPLGLVAALAGVKLEAGFVMERLQALGEASFIEAMRMSWRLLLDPVRVFNDALKEAIRLYEQLRVLLGGSPRNVSENQLGGKPGGDIPRNALGTASFPGGLAWVGERGPELVSLPRGSRIWPAQQSMAMAGAGAGGSGVVVNINGDTYVRNEEDMNALVWKIVREVKRRER